MAIVAAVVDIVGTVQSCEKLKQKAGFITAPSAEIQKVWSAPSDFSFVSIRSNASRHVIVR